MSSRPRTMSFPRFSKTNLQRVLSAKSRRRFSNDAASYSYESLEARQLLSADVGASFTTVNNGSPIFSDANPPNISAAVGENHIVQFVNTGYSIWDKGTGNALLQQGSLEQFFAAAGTPAVDNDGDAVTLSQPRLVYDSGFERWYVIAVDNQDLNDNAPGNQGNRIFIAGTSTPDPTGPWRSETIQLDTGTLDANGNIDFLFRTERLNLSIDEVGLTISAQELIITPFGEQPVGTAVLGLPQVALFGGDIETFRAEIGRGIGNADIGFEIQFGLDSTIAPQSFPVTSTASVFSLAIDGEADQDTFPPGRQGDELVLTEFTRQGTPNVDLGLAIGAITRIPIDFYREPDVVRQPTDIIRDRDSALFNASVAQEGRFLYAAHSVRDVVTLPDGTQAEGPNAVIRWYKVDTQPQVDPATGQLISLVDSGVIRATTNETDFIDPSIDVSENGTVAIGYTATGLDLFPSSFVSIGVPSAGIDSPLAFNDPFELRAGESTYIDLASGGLPNHFFGRYTTTINDPFDPNSFWTFQQYTGDDNNWAIEVTQVGPSDTNPVITVDPANLDNIIEINQVGDNIEVVVDGVITGVFDSDGIGLLTVDGNGGFDQFFVNVPDLDAAAITGTYNLIGDGDDTLQLNVSSDTVWQFDGGLGVNINSGRVLANGIIEFQAGDGDDRFEFPTSNYNFPVFAGAGNDVFVVEQNVTGNLQLFGEVGDDVYNLPATSFSGVAISDSVGSENDQLTSTGTDGQDVINVDENSVTINGIEVPFDDAVTSFGIETFAIDAFADDDTFNITSTTRDFFLFGQRGSDTFNVTETTAMTGGAVLVIDGGEDSNSLNVFQNDALAPSTVVIDSALITNTSSAAISFVATGGTFAETATSTGVSVFGSDTRSDTIEVVGVLATNDLTVSGRAADDLFIFENNIDGTAELLGGDGDDRYEVNSSSIFDVVITDSVDAEADVIDVGFTENDDVIEVTETGFLFNGVAYPTTDASFTGIEDFVLDGLGGNDTFNIDRTTTFTSFRGSDGDDIFNVTDLTVTTGATETSIDGGAGNDQLNVTRNEFVGTQAIVNETSITGMTIAAINYSSISLLNLFGSDNADDFVVATLLPATLLRIEARDGDDMILVERAAEGNIDLLGETGSDTYRVEVQGDKTRLVQLIDPAADAGDDRAEIVYTTAADEIILDGRIVGLGSDSVDVNPEIEVLALEGSDGNDRFSIISTQNPRVELFGQVGDDIYDILGVGALASEIAIFDSVGAENDTILVAGTAGVDEFVIDADSITVNGESLTAPGAGSITGVEGFTFDGLEDDDVFRINSTTRGFNYFGSGGNDQFFVTDDTVTTGTPEFFIDGGDGVDVLTATRNEFVGTQAIVNETTLTGLTLATVNYSSIGLLNLNGSVAADDFVVETLLPSTFLRIDALVGNDTILVERAAEGNIDLLGGIGADTYRIEVQGDKTRLVQLIDPAAVAGNDRAEIVYTTDADEIILDGRIVGLGNDSVDVSPEIEVLALEGLAGNDRFTIIGPQNPRVELFGQAGDDIYDILGAGALASEIAIFDSVGAENDTLLVEGTVGADEFVINEDSITINGVSLTSPGAGEIIGVEGFTFDGREDDDIFRINSTTRGFNYLGSGGNDQFFVTDATVTTGATEFFIDGGTGSNELFVSRAAILGGAAAGTEIQIEDNRIVGATIAEIEYFATDGIFSLLDLTGSAGATAGDDVFDDIFRVNTLAAETLLNINALGGNDTIDVAAAAAGDVNIEGGLGNDNFLVELGGGVDRVVTVDDVGGTDRIDVFFSDAAETINVIDTTNRINYAAGSSSVNFEPTLESLALHGLGGDDVFIVTGTTTDELILAGGEGDDTYDLGNVFGNTFVSVIDSVNAENDTLRVEGTNGADTFIINENSFLINGTPFIVDDPLNSNIIGIESLEVDALDGDDTFIVNSATRGFALLGGAGNDDFIIHDTAPDSGASELVIDGGTGANTLDIQRIAGTPIFAVIEEETIRNVANSTIRYSATGGSFTGGNGGITIRGLDDVNDSFLVFTLLPENSLELLGGGGNDFHRVAETVAGDVFSDGAEGFDRYVYLLNEDASRNLVVADSGTDGAVDRINTFLTQNSDIVVLDGTEIALNNDVVSFEPTIETIEILAGEGDDNIDVRRFDGVNFLRVNGGVGNDTLSTNRAFGVNNVMLVGDVGNDTFDLVSSSQLGFIGAIGGDGEDFFRVGEDFFRNAEINGGNDDDRYDISFADRGRRFLSVSDSGTGGNDTAIVRATDVATQLTLRASGINSPFQLVGTTRQLESLELIGTEGRDIINMFAVPVVNMTINTLTGSDILNINSNNGAENLNINLGAEGDIANILATAPGTTTTLTTGLEDDLVNIGSTLASNSGNLDALQGALTIDFGEGSDRLFLSDSQSSGANGYTLSDSQVLNNNSVRTRNFSGLSYSNAEFTQIIGNVQFNQFTVSPSEDVRFIVDGNLPQTNQLTVTGSNDGRQLLETGDFSGIFFFDDLRDVQFEQFTV